MLSHSIHRIQSTSSTLTSFTHKLLSFHINKFSSTNNNNTDSKQVKSSSNSTITKTVASATTQPPDSPITTTRVTTLNIPSLNYNNIRGISTSSKQPKYVQPTHGSLVKFDSTSDSSIFFTTMEASKLITHNYQQITSLFYGYKYNTTYKQQSSIVATPAYTHTKPTSNGNNGNEYTYDTSIQQSTNTTSNDQNHQLYDSEQYYKHSLRHVLGGTLRDVDTPISALQKQSISIYNLYHTRKYKFRPQLSVQRTVPINNNNTESNTQLNAHGINVVLDTDTTPDTIELDSVKRKRKKKMNKHKLKKRRKQQRMATRKDTAK